ncbi:restriction endonuclease subunit S [Glutamicibacter creatinolyticus]|uniref:restriction endonuclease subunit S n=1 Tax=Glutamicibacter creatinolyticus TaxID=162496 RepID=UPI0031DCF34F
MSQVIEYKLTDLLSLIVDNRGRSCPTADTGIPLIATNCIKDNELYPVFENLRFVDEATYSTWFRAHPIPGDIIFVCKGSPGRTALVPDPVTFCIAQDMVALRADPATVNNRYLYYLLQSKETRRKIENMHVGTMIPHFKKGDFHRLVLPIHSDLSQQLAIAEVLGALDDKIAANAKIAATADELAVTEYRQALASANYTDATFADLAKVSGGGTPSTKEPAYWAGDIPWATPTDITALAGPYLEATSRTITEVGLSACASELYPEGSILMTSRATIGAFALAQVPTAVNQGFIVVQPNDPQLHFWIFHEMRSRVDEFISLANGATFLELSRGNFKKFKVRTASPDIMHSFNEIAMGLHRAARGALLENKTLATTRDALLPQLMSGKLRVRDAEAVVEALL